MNTDAPSHQHLESLVRDSGIWTDDRADTHRFRLTRTLARYSPQQVADINRLGLAINEMMKGMSRLVTIASNGTTSPGNSWALVRTATNMMAPRYMRDLQPLFPQRVPHIVKVDYMEDADGALHIAEIDATNRRGMGYTSLFEKLRAALDPNCVPMAKPIIPALAEHVKRLCGKDKPQVGYVYAHKERFYLAEFEILKRELAAHGVELLLGSEYETGVDHFADQVIIGNTRCTSGLVADFALKLERMDLAAQFADLYRRSKVRLLIPARPFLGSKALLGLLHNATPNPKGGRPEDRDPRLEAILLSQIDPDALALVRKHTPVTRFVTADTARPERGVLKEVMSSGMHGVYFASNVDFDKAFDDARRRPFQYVLQDEIDCAERPFDTFAPDGTVVTEQLRTRLIVHYINHEPAGGVVTAGHGKSIHGGTQAVFTSTAR